MRKLIVVVAALGALSIGCASGDSTETSAVPDTTTTEGSVTETTVTTAPETTSTAAETTTTTEAPAVETVPVAVGDPDHDQIAELFAVVFDGDTSFDEKSPYIDDPAGLESTVTAYAQAAKSVGGLSLVATDIGIEGDKALIIYDLYFGESPFQVDQEGEALRGEEHWQVTRRYFCSIVKLARVNCS